MNIRTRPTLGSQRVGTLNRLGTLSPPVADGSRLAGIAAVIGAIGGMALQYFRNKKELDQRLERNPQFQPSRKTTGRQEWKPRSILESRGPRIGGTARGNQAFQPDDFPPRNIVDRPNSIERQTGKAYRRATSDESERTTMANLPAGRRALRPPGCFRCNE